MDVYSVGCPVGCHACAIMLAARRSARLAAELFSATGAAGCGTWAIHSNDYDSGGRGSLFGSENFLLLLSFFPFFLLVR